MKNTHIATGIILIPVCLWCLFWLIPQNSEPPTSELDLSPALIPSVAVATCLLAAIIMLIRALRASDAEAREMDEEFGDEASGINLAVLANTLWWTLAALGAWWLISNVGFEPAMALLTAATMLFVGVRKPWTIVFTALLMPVVLSQASWQFFSTQLPGFWR